MPPKKASKARSAGAIHFVTGSDESAVKRAAQEIVSKLVPADAGEFGLEIVDGNVDGVDRAISKIEEAIQALLTMPFFGGNKVVWLKNAAFFADSPTGRSENVASALEKLFQTLEAGLPQGIGFVVSAPEPDKRRKGYKTLTGLADLHLFDKQELSSDPEERMEGIRQRAASISLNLSPDALEVLTVRVSDSARQLDVELEKLAIAADSGGPIGADEVRLLVPATRESGIFDLSNAILRRDLPQALATLRQLFSQGESAIGILLVAVFPTVRNLLIVSDLMKRHRLRPPSQPFHFAGILSKLPEAETAHLPRKKDGGINAYPLGIAAASASRFSTPGLIRSFVACRKANEALVTSQLPDELILEKLLTGILAA